MWKFLADLFRTHEQCRCCGIKIENGGYGVVFVGSGFCLSCASELLKPMKQ